MDEATHEFDWFDLPDHIWQIPGSILGGIFTHEHPHDRHTAGPDHPSDFSHRHEHRWGSIQPNYNHHEPDPDDDPAVAVDHADDPHDNALDNALD